MTAVEPRVLRSRLLLEPRVLGRCLLLEDVALKLSDSGSLLFSLLLFLSVSLTVCSGHF